MAEVRTVKTRLVNGFVLTVFFTMNSAWACQFAPAPPENDDQQVSMGAYVYALLTSEQKQPTVGGTLEHDPAFKEAARRAWEEVGYGDLPQEAGFMVSRDRKMSPVQLGKEIDSKETVGATNFKIPSGGAFAILYTHPRPSRGRPWLQQPSQPDIDVGKNFRLNVFVVSASGLWLAEPDGNLIHVFTNNDWMNKKMTRAVAGAAPQSASSINVTTLPSVKLTPQAWHPQIILRIHNYARVDAKFLFDAEAVAATILREAKVDARWVYCPITQEEFRRYPECPADWGTNGFVLNILTPEMVGRIQTHVENLESAPAPCPEDATSCPMNVYYSRVVRYAGEFSIQPEQLLGHVLAHEVGHMLGVDHSSNGIMRGEWSRNDLKLMGFSTLCFSTDQAAQLRARLLRRATQQKVAQNLKSVPSR
jgi:hypothetical protein